MILLFNTLYTTKQYELVFVFNTPYTTKWYNHTWQYSWYNKIIWSYFLILIIQQNSMILLFNTQHAILFSCFLILGKQRTTTDNSASFLYSWSFTKIMDRFCSNVYCLLHNIHNLPKAKAEIKILGERLRYCVTGR